MIEIRKSKERYASKRDWLDSKHTFGFGNVGEPRFMGYRTLRILNEDKVAPAGGFGMHQHEDMEIVSYVLEGTVAHRDSLGSGGLICPGEIQRMTAGSGIRHSEINASDTDPAHFLQIWIQPCKKGLHPSYEQRPMPTVTAKAQLDLIGSHDGRDGSVLIHQDVNLYRATLRDGASLTVRLAAGRNAWVHVARGAAVMNDLYIDVGDGAAVSSEAELTLVGRNDAELLVFDLR